MALATLGAGCFWSTEKSFRKEFGKKLISGLVGYMIAGDEIADDRKNHVEVFQISFDEFNVTYKDLVRFFFHMHDPTMANKSNHDRATQYRSMIFTHTKDQQEIAERIRDELQTNDMFIGQIITQIQPIDGWKFSIAEAKHQNYLDNKYGWLMCS